jgi:hypothetical protein
MHGVMIWIPYAELLVSDFQADLNVMSISNGATVTFARSSFTGNVVTFNHPVEAIILVEQVWVDGLYPFQEQDTIVTLEKCTFVDNSAFNLITAQNFEDWHSFNSYKARVFSDNPKLRVLQEGDLTYVSKPAEPLSAVPAGRQGLSSQPQPQPAQSPVRLIVGIVGGVVALVLLVAVLITIVCCARHRPRSQGTHIPSAPPETTVRIPSNGFLARHISDAYFAQPFEAANAFIFRCRSLTVVTVMCGNMSAVSPVRYCAVIPQLRGDIKYAS